MEEIVLKNSDIKVSRICMGGCPMGGYGWGDTQENELIGAVHTALECGVNFFDTADTYGLGQSEITLGKALEGSLRRLGTDYIDLYQVHYRDGKTALEDVVETLEKLKAKGYICSYGLSNIHKKDMEEIIPFTGKFASFQDEYSLACRKNEADLLEISEKLQMTPFTWGSLGQGILTGKYTKENVCFESNDRRSRDIYVNFHGEKLMKNLEIVEHMKEIAEKYEKSVAAVAIRYILDFIPESVVLCGAKRPSQILSNVEGSGWSLNREDVEKLDGISR